MGQPGPRAVVHVGEPLLWDVNFFHWCTGLSGDFSMLACHTLSTLLLHIRGLTWPH